MSQTTQKSLEALPIDIHFNKLLDWLVNRRHCTQQSQALVTVIRDKVTKARQNSQADGHSDKQILQLLDIPQPNYFQVKKLFELLKDTASGKKNLIGQYTSQSMKSWAEILKLYEKDGTYMAESALTIVRNVNYEVPAIKKQISKCQQTQKDCLRKENEFASGAADLRKQYAASCKEIGIEGAKIKTELSNLVKDLPKELSKFAESAKSLDDAVKFYDMFTAFVLSKESVQEENLRLLKHLLSKGNTTTFEWRTGKPPSRVDAVEIAIDLSDEQDAAASGEGHNGDIDWGLPETTDDIDFGGEIDFDIGDIVVESGGVLAANGEIELENPDIDAIDWGAADDITESQCEITNGIQSDVASGKDALSLIDNPETRNAFVDDLLELQAFLKQRLIELSNDSSDGSHMSSASSDLHLDKEEVTIMLTKVKDILDKLTSVQMQHLLLIRDSPRYVDRLRDSLRHKLVLADKMGMSEREMAATRLEALEEEQELIPQLETLKKHTKLIQKQLQDEISKKYNDRKVNIIGEINTL